MDMLASRGKIPRRKAIAMLRAGLPLERSELRGNSKRGSGYVDKARLMADYVISDIGNALRNLKKRNRNDEMIESFNIRKRPGHPDQAIVVVKHRYYVNGARVYSAGLNTENTIANLARIVGTKRKRIGNSDYVFNIYGINLPKSLKPMPGKLFGNSSMSERYKKKSAQYLVTKKFTGGAMKGLTIVDKSPVPFYVGFKPSKPYFGSPYIVTKTEINYAGSKR